MTTRLAMALVAMASLFSTTALGQTKSRPIIPPPCPLKKEQFAKVRGLYLGMPASEVSQLFPPLKLDTADEAGESLMSYQLNAGRAIKGLEGIWSMILNFLDGRLYYYWIYYDDYEVRSMEEHARNISQKLNLPYRWDKKRWRLRCQDFSVYAVVYGRPGIVVEDDTANRELEARRAQDKAEKSRKEAERSREEEQRRRVFRP
jgi:hypothetical protein